MRALIILSLITFVQIAAAYEESHQSTLMVCEDGNGDYAEVTVDLDTKEVTVQDLASSENWIRRKLNDLDSVYSVHTKGLEIRETKHSDKLLNINDLNVARSIKILFLEPQDVFSGGAVKMGIHKADELVMTKDDHGNWSLEFGRAKHGYYDGFYQTIGKNCDLKIAGFFDGWKPKNHHKAPKSNGSQAQAEGLN